MDAVIAKLHTMHYFFPLIGCSPLAYNDRRILIAIFFNFGLLITNIFSNFRY